MKSCAAGAALLAVLLTAGCNSVFFYPEKDRPGAQKPAQGPREDVWFASPDGVRLHGWFLRTAAPARGTVLFFHGADHNIAVHIQAVEWLVPEGYQVLAVDYRGYGASEGHPDMAGVHTDALAAMDEVFRIRGVDREKVVVFGQSLGGGIATWAVAHSAWKSSVKALVIDSAFAGYRRIAKDTLAARIVSWPFRYPLSWLADDSYSAERWIGKISPIPVVIIHGTRDHTVPLRHAEVLYDAAGEPKKFWLDIGGEHVSALSDPDMRRRFLGFLAKTLPAD